MDQSKVKTICPRPVGWLEYTLSQDEIDYLWKRIENKGPSHKAYLIGHIAHSFKLHDKNDWFFNNTLFLYFKRGFGVLRVKFSILDPKPAHKIINVKFFINYKYFSYIDLSS